MRAAVLIEPFRIELVERDVPQPTGGQLRIRVDQCGLCASELAAWTGSSPTPPSAPGHEVAGVVEDVGSAVSTLQRGDRVAAWVRGGGFAEQMLVEERFCVPVAPRLPYPAVAEPLACVVNAVELAAPPLGADVVIIGAGYMGNLVQLVTALKGPRSITVADVRPDALERARALGGLTRTVDTRASSLDDVVRDMTDGRGADLTYEVAGSESGLALAGEVTRTSGKLCIVGYHQRGPLTLDIGRWNAQALEIVNAHFRELDTIMAGMRAGMRLIHAGILDASPLVTHRYPLTAVAEAFATAAARPAGFVKAVVEPAAHEAS